jgi:hypothetical protein
MLDFICKMWHLKTFTTKYVIVWRQTERPAGDQKFGVLVYIYWFFFYFHFSTVKVQPLQPTLVSPMIHPRSALSQYIPSPWRLVRVAGLRQSTVLHPFHVPTPFLLPSVFLSTSTVSAKLRCPLFVPLFIWSPNTHPATELRRFQLILPRHVSHFTSNMKMGLVLLCDVSVQHSLTYFCWNLFQSIHL